MRFPNFLLIGAPKCGTTSLWQYLRQHPDVFMPELKEPRFFAYEGGIPRFRGPGDVERERDTITDAGRYAGLFEGRTERAIGEASPIYLYDRGAPARIKRYAPEVRLLAVLRHPIDRAHSNFVHQLYHGREQLGFEEALAEEPRRIAADWGPFWHYLALGRYSEQIERYFALFDRKRVRIYLYDDLVSDPRQMLRDIFRFLEVDDTFTADISRRYRVGGTPRRRALARAIYQPSWVKDLVRPIVPERVRDELAALEARYNRARPPLARSLRARLLEQLKSEIERLARVIDRDLSSWMRRGSDAS